MQRIGMLVVALLMMVSATLGSAAPVSADGNWWSWGSMGSFFGGTAATCTKHGQVAVSMPNMLSGGQYGVVPIGGLNEPCGVVFQGWTTMGGTERFVFYVPPRSVVWVTGFNGGTGWYFNPQQEDPAANLQRQAEELLQRDGSMPTTLAILPTHTFRLVVDFRSN